MTELSKAYDPKVVEDAIYARWEASGFFNPDNLVGIRDQGLGSRVWWWRLLSKLQVTSYELRVPFTIVMPPPNVTGTLHVGHAVMLAIQDLMIRFARMRGRPALWIPGTDHAAIATQTVVERKLIKEGTKDPRRTLGREAFLKKVEEFAATSHDRIVTQIKKMGASCDWSREAYTLDEARSLAVRTMFKKMYDDGLIYRGYRVVNWCPRCKSTLADDEVEYKEESTKFYYFKYGPIVIGTARPETKFLDKTITVHPDDPRYKEIVGKEFDVEWIEGLVKAQVIADPVIDPDFGTGAMTLTPGHSHEDFDLAQKHGLEIKKIIDENGNLTEAAGTFAGRNAREAREEIVEQLGKKGLVDHIDENYTHRLSVCYRCDTPIEPLPKEQWFVDVKKKVRGRSLKERMHQAVASGKIEIIPERFLKTYFHWVDNLRDWCISRQIWFGHRIPVWYRKNLEPRSQNLVELYVGVEAPEGEGWTQDEDTLDTWFSAALWTFSTLGWPMNCERSRDQEIKRSSCIKRRDLAAYHPTSVLETGYDILFFWIARMILATTYALDEVPFKTVYLHGLVRDEQGRKMSKSLGNVIDPLDMTQKYGADATRLSLVLGTAPGNDVKLSEAKIAGFRNFTNKLWNIARFVLTVIGERSRDQEIKRSSIEARTLADRWILNELDRVTGEVTRHLEKYELAAAGDLLRDFTWSSFADWYLEIAKFQIPNSKFQIPTQTILRYCLDRLLRLWHPFMPFVTEHIWQLIRPLSLEGRGQGEGGRGLLMVEPWPSTPLLSPSKEGERMRVVQEIVGAIRNLRATYRVESGKSMAVTINAGPEAAWLIKEKDLIAHLAKAEPVTIEERATQPTGAVTQIIGTIEVSVSLAGLVDMEKERGRLFRAIEEARAYISGLKQKLADQDFIARAPQVVVEADRSRLAEAENKLSRLEEHYETLA